MTLRHTPLNFRSQAWNIVSVRAERCKRTVAGLGLERVDAPCYRQVHSASALLKNILLCGVKKKVSTAKFDREIQAGFR